MDKRTVIAAVIAGAIGIGIGGSFTESQTVTVTKHETKTVETVPDSCLRALDLADAGYALVAKAFAAVAAGDSATLDNLTGKYEQKAKPYGDAKSTCRLKAGALS